MIDHDKKEQGGAPLQDARAETQSQQEQARAVEEILAVAEQEPMDDPTLDGAAQIPEPVTGQPPAQARMPQEKQQRRAEKPAFVRSRRGKKIPAELMHAQDGPTQEQPQAHSAAPRREKPAYARTHRGKKVPAELMYAQGYQPPEPEAPDGFGAKMARWFASARSRFFAMPPKRRVLTVCAVAAPLCALVLLCVTIGFLISGARTGGPASTDAARAASITPAPTFAVATPTPTPVATPTPVPTPTPEPHPTNMVIRQGIHAPFVQELQKRLMELYYMEDDEPTDYFGPVTEMAVRLFQRQHGLDIDGMVGMETYQALFSPEAQHYTVMLEASGSDVTELQTRLREMGYLDTVTGYFGEKTEEAVKAFQKNNKLTADGKVGRQTREKLYSSGAQANFAKYADSSKTIKLYQQRLKDLGYLTTTPDGKYGTDTKQAVARFQEIHGLIPDGFLGYSTVQKLQSSSAKGNALQFGMNGDDVKNVQKYLKRLGYMDAVTGYFGTITEEAVKAFQKNNKIAVDGTVGPVTMSKLTASQAIASSGSSGSTGAGTTAQTNKIDTFISVAQGKLGCSYVFGTKGPTTFDCSGFVYYCLNKAGVSQSYMTSAGWAECTKYQRISSMSSLKRGDVMVFSGTNYGHVGIYLGDGQMIHASSGKGKVVTSTGVLKSNYWTSHFICGFRIF